MVRKKAIIIGSSGGYRDLQELTAISYNTNDYKSFLLSPAGGAWREKEIVMLHNVSSDRIVNEIKNIEADYTLTIYCGYGAISTYDRSDLLGLLDTDLTIVALITSSVKQTIILDVVNGERMTNCLPSHIQKNDIDQALEMSAIKTYETELVSLPKGILIVYSCSKFESAGYDVNVGTHFSYSLLKSSREWWYKSDGDVLRINNAIELAAREISSSFQLKQSPVFGGQSRRLTFPPFALSQ